MLSIILLAVQSMLKLIMLESPIIRDSWDYARQLLCFFLFILGLCSFLVFIYLCLLFQYFAYFIALVCLVLVLILLPCSLSVLTLETSKLNMLSSI